MATYESGFPSLTRRILFCKISPPFLETWTKYLQLIYVQTCRWQILLLGSIDGK